MKKHIMIKHILKNHILVLVLFFALGLVVAAIASRIEEDYSPEYDSETPIDVTSIDVTSIDVTSIDVTGIDVTGIEATNHDSASQDVTSLDATPSDAEVVHVMSDKEIEDMYIEKIMSKMTMDEKIAQLFLVACPTGIGTDIQTKYQFGGYLLFSRDFEGMSAEDVRQVIESYQGSSKIPMIIAVDEEGGTVCRVSNKSQFRQNSFMSPRNLYSQGGMEAIIAEEEEKAELLRGLGINVNMNPVCDISDNPGDFMYKRSLGESPEITSDFVVSVIKANKKHDMGTVLKHFPGYGNNVDTHTGIAVDDRTYETFEKEDLKPFVAGIENDCQSILVSHNIINCMDSDYPASLSKKVHRILRDKLKFDGVIMTDDISMQAVKSYSSKNDVAVTSILAGNDMVCCHDYDDCFAAVKSAVSEGVICEERINESVIRILRWKIDLGIIIIPTQ